MLTNNINNKLKASKSSRDLEDREVEKDTKCKILDKGDADKETSEHLSGRRTQTTIIVNQRDKFGDRDRAKPRMARGSLSEKKAAPFARKPPRENDNSYSARSKYSDSSGRALGSDNSPSNLNKRYTNGSDCKRSDLGSSSSDDCRISKLLRRIGREDDPDKFISLCKQLQDAFNIPDNTLYIRRFLELIMESLLDVLHSGPNSQCKTHAAHCLGQVGYVVEHDFKRFSEWLFSKYCVERNEDVRTLLMKALLKTLELEGNKPRLKSFAPSLMSQMQSVLETTDLPELFEASVKVILALTDLYPDTLNKYFRDTVDILVGWHIDSTQPERTTQYASESLQRLSSFWVQDLSFSLTMLTQFLEDMGAYEEDLHHAAAAPGSASASASSGHTASGDEPNPSVEDCLRKITSFIKVFNTVTKSLGAHLSPVNSPAVTWVFLNDCLANMLYTVQQALNAKLDDDLIVTANECAWLILSLLGTKTSAGHDRLYQLLETELRVVDNVDDLTICSIIGLAAKTVREVSANLPLSLVRTLLGPESNVLKLRFSPSQSVQKAVLCLYHSFLYLKNIPLLQEAYRYVLADLEIAYRLLVPSIDSLCQVNPLDGLSYKDGEAEAVVLFSLKALADIANASNSIIGMWALKPSILELLAICLKPQQLKNRPHLHYTVLYLLHSHCSRYNHFVSSSCLVQSTASRVTNIMGLPTSLNSDVPVNSPTAAHLTNILSLLKDTLESETCEEVELLGLRWVRDIVSQETFLPALLKTQELNDVLFGVVKKAMSAAGNEPVASIVCCTLLDIMLSPRTFKLQVPLLAAIVKLCLVLVSSTNEKISRDYSRLLSSLPWNVTLPIVAATDRRVDTKENCDKTSEMLLWAQQTHLTRGNNGEMGLQHFRQFMGYLLQGQEQEKDWLCELFSNCCLLEPLNVDETSGTQTKRTLSTVALYSKPVLLQWAAWEAAQFCVSCKLRTPLGKPQDTFTTIEGVIKKLARDVESGSRWDAGRVRLLLDFVEQLEKVMYNAADGTATAIVAPSKPVRTFFHTNRSTCAEWLTRIRLAVVVVALRAGQAAAAVRHGQALLQTLVDTNNTQGVQFERTVIYLACGLGRLQEWESVMGLYVWCRDEIGLKLPFLKAIAEHSAGRLEHAADLYQQYLQISVENSENENDHLMRCLAQDQLAGCYRNLEDWEKCVSSGKVDTESSHSNGGSFLLSRLTRKQAEALAHYEAGEIAAAANLMEWDSAEPEKKECTWNALHLVETSHSNLLSVALFNARKAEDPESSPWLWMKTVESASNDAQLLLQEGLRNTPSEFLQEATLLQSIAMRLETHFYPSRQKFYMNGGGDLSSLRPDVLSSALWWSECIAKTYNVTDPLVLADVRVNGARIARKTGNPTLALRLLARQVGPHSGASLDELTSSAVQPVSEWTAQHAKTLKEVAKALHCKDKKDLGVSVVAHTVDGARGSDCIELRETSSRLLLTLAKWLQADNGLSTNPAVQLLLQYVPNASSELSGVQNWNLPSEVIPSTDAVVGRLMQQAVLQCPTLGKSWAHFAGWCYRWGRRVVDVTSETGGQLNESDRERVRAMLPERATSTDFDSVLAILDQKRSLTDEEDIDMDVVKTSDMMEAQLRMVAILKGSSSEVLEGLVGVWREAQQRVYSCYKLSAVAYFKFLQLCGHQEGCVEQLDTVTASLRILRLVVKHALELQSALEDGLAATPTAPWKAIIPQLFSRLGHPEPYVRKRVAELLCRLAQDAPHLITFPAVVGAASEGARLRNMPMPSSTSRLFNACLSPIGEVADVLENEDEEEDEDEDEEDEEGEEGAVLKNCFLAMVDTLAKQAPEAISQVQLLVCELRRVTLLWDELWLGTLNQHHAEIARRITQLEAETQRVDNNPSLTSAEKDALVAEKYRIILKPLMFILEQLQAITSVPPETPHEKWFQDKFGECIEKSLSKLKEPSNPRRPQEWWQCLKQLEQRLGTRMNKRAAYSLHMEDVSPALAGLKNSRIAMPGVASRQGKIVTISAVHSHIAILPTKTKPKKLLFYGSDGKTYTYLFKGLEDLHLDERIMQLLQIANTMLQSQPQSQGGDVYRAHYYSVIPLGPRSGLISWVDDVTPLFGLYKRWQQREAAATSSASATSTTTPSASLKNAAQPQPQPTTVMRPSELFYAKLTPRLKELGVSVDNRKEWPLATLRQVLQELMAETPSQLLAKELWCHSVNAGGWWKICRTYSHSVAVMSVIGYIIGLGDRHLDNVLVNLSSGEVVHIDYNVCFEKGRTLRVPEKVPFRMTPNIQAALGVTGVEGIFRLASEHVLKVMKKGRETLLTLLEAFVYDPLIDWTTGNEAGYAGAVYGGGGQAIAMETKQSRRDLEREVTRSMFTVRVMEIKADWMHNRDDMVAALQGLSLLLSQLEQGSSQLEKAQTDLQDCHALLALVKEAEVQAPTRAHALYTLAQRHGALSKAHAAQDAARALLNDKLAEWDLELAQYKSAMQCVRSQQLTQGVPFKQQLCLVFEYVTDFLHKAGQGLMVTQCQQLGADINAFSSKQAKLVESIVDLLKQYSAVCGLFPNSYVQRHRIVCYQRWATTLIHDLSIPKCQEVVGEFGALFSPVNNTTPRQQIISYAVGLQNALSKANMEREKRFSSLEGETCAQVAERLEYVFEAGYPVLDSLVFSGDIGDTTGVSALKCAIITALTGLNKRFLIIEAAAKGAGECLVDLTRDGNWFLDDMCLMSSTIVKMLSLPLRVLGPSCVVSDKLDIALECLRTADGIYHGLQELNVNFQSIILPESVAAMRTQEPTVVAMVADLCSLVDESQVPIPELLDQLEIHLRCLVMGMDSPHREAQFHVAQLRKQLDNLLGAGAAHKEDESTLTAGQMLLMGFNGLFDKLQLQGQALAISRAKIEEPTCWRIVDQIRDAKYFAVPVFDEATRSVLEDIFLMKRLLTMRDFFVMCSVVGRGFRGEPVDCRDPILVDDERLNRPVRRFTADYVSRQLRGVMTHTLAITICILLEMAGLNVTAGVKQRDIGAGSEVTVEEMCQLAAEGCIGPSKVPGLLGQMSAVISAMETSWRRVEAHSSLTAALELHSAAARRLQLELTTYHWLHHASLKGAPRLSLPPFTRTSFLHELQLQSGALLMLQPRLSDLRERFNTLVGSVEQRLRWAAGANPAVNEVMSAFERAVRSQEEKLQHEQRLAGMVTTTSTAVLHHEVLRDLATPEGMAQDTAFLQLVDKCEQSCTTSPGENGLASLSAAEENLVQLVPVEGTIDTSWILKAEVIISENVKVLQLKMSQLQEMVVSTQERVKAQVNTLRNCFAVHSRLMADVRTLMKSIAKFEEGSIDGLADYLSRYRSYTEQLCALMRQLAAEELDSNAVSRGLKQVEALIESTGCVYQDLLSFQQPLFDQSEKTRRPPLLRQQSVWMSPKKNVAAGKAGQERNAYAVSVWRRVRMKLEGRDPDPVRRATVQEQVDYIIREATSVDNLALLYEGWTPWV